MKHYDVVIVGAATSGSFEGWCIQADALRKQCGSMADALRQE